MVSQSDFLRNAGRSGNGTAVCHAALPRSGLVQCTLCRCRHNVHKHRNLLAHAPERLHEEITADYTDMIYAATPEEIEVRRKAFIRKWRLKHRAVADSLEEAGDALFAFTRLPPSQWKSARTTDEMDKRFLRTSPIRGESTGPPLRRPRRGRHRRPGLPWRRQHQGSRSDPA